ncbi:MAG: DUF2339 domain-containing protein [Opitutae bacterium]|nr:DUF2339 domain-containing protein [Opitutae bacterium]
MIVLLALWLIAALVVIPVWLIVRTNRQRDEIASLSYQVSRLEDQLKQLAAKPREEKTPAPAAVAAKPAAPVIATPPAPTTAQLPPQPAPAAPAPQPAVVAPPPVLARPRVPAPVPVAYTPPPRQPSWTENINWEQFMGAKLFAWLGGLALFLGVAFFVKYSFEHDLIPPAVRVAIGFVLGAGLIVGGLRMPRDKYAVTSQTLIGAGVVSLYAVTFACNSIYHFAFFGPIPTFLLMVLITATAFIIAVRLESQVVALLGLLGGFLTPVLLSTGVDNPGGLFGYLALLDAGLIAVALRTPWLYLVPLSAGCTVLMMIGWAEKFLTAEKGPVAMVVCLGFSALYLAAAEIARRREVADRFLSWTAAAMPAVGLAFGLAFLGYPPLAARAPLYFGYILLLDAALLTLVWRDDSMPRLHFAAGMAVFAVLGLWTSEFVTADTLPWALAGYLVFAAAHTAFPLLLERVRPASTPTWWSQLFPPLTLVLMLVPIMRLDAVPLLIWPAILLVDLLAIGLALLSASLTAVAAVLVLTLVATGACIFKIPAAVVFAPSLLFVIGGFSLFFFAAGFWLVRKLGDKLPAADKQLAGILGDTRAQIPAFSALLPFLLLIMLCARLSLPDPSAVFGLGLLLVVLTLGLARLLVIEWLPACALAGIAALEYVWHSGQFAATSAGLPLVWYLGFYAVFAVYPFFFRREFSRLTGPWAVAALSGPVHFWMAYGAIKAGWPNDFLGLVPALFAGAPLASLALRLRAEPAENPKRLNQLAWFGAVALFFITLVFPIQFERQWLTVAWALEGAALLWLFHRVPHPGLRLVGVALLCTAFARLALNPAVVAYHARSDTAVFNWYLYAYGLTVAALFTGARLLAPPRDNVLGSEAPPLLNGLGTVLAFILLNIEIADYFTPAGARTLTFQFSGSFARDMTYTIAWALFALGLLGAGILKQQRPARYAAIGLLSAALLKLFFHDLARLEALYRIGALFAVAVIAILASFAYQRFLPGHEKSDAPRS